MENCGLGTDSHTTAIMRLTIRLIYEATTRLPITSQDNPRTLHAIT